MKAGPRTPGGGGLRAAAGLAALAVVAGLVLIGLLRPDLLGHGVGQGVGHGAGAAFHGAPADGPTVAAARDDPAGLMGHILARIYTAFGEREEDAIYDALATVAAGPVLEELYLERRAALTAAPAEGGGQAIHGIAVLDAAAAERDGAFVIDGAWETIGSVGHGDHVHVRGNRYAARFTVEPRADGWRLTAFDLVEKVRAEAVE